MTDEVKTEAPTPAPKKPPPKTKLKSRTVVEKQLLMHAKQIAALGKELATVKERVDALGQVYAQVMAAVAAAKGPAVPNDPQITMINETRTRGTPPQPVNNKPPEPVKILDEQTFRINARMRGEIVEGLARERDRPPGASKQ
jgi:hypothetical protein